MQISIQELTKTYKTGDSELTIINNLSFDFAYKQSQAIVGRSGVGKSSLLQLLGGLDTPSTGFVAYDQQRVSEMTLEARAGFRCQHIGFIFQFHHLLPEFDVRENVAMPLLIAGLSLDEAYVRAEQLLQRFALGQRLEHRPGQLSGGEQQRVAIARALVHDPTVVLADEPTGNLDVSTASEITELLLEFQSKTETTLIVVTHSRELASKMSHVYEMSPGGGLKEVVEG